MKHFWCKKPFVEIDTNGLNARPCCVFKPRSPMLLENYLTNPELHDVRSTILRGDIPEQCVQCVLDERQTGKSFRTQSNAFDLFDHDSDLLTEHNTVIDHVLISSGNVCNLRCIHCSPQASYARGREMHKLGLLSDPPRLHPSYLKSFYDTDIEFRKLTLLGGEPFYDRDIIRFLTQLPQTKNTSQVDLDINSNITHIDIALLDFLVKNYRRVQIKASIDGFSESNDYLRYPSHWQDITDSVKLIQTYPSIELSITTSISNLSILHLPKLINWVIDQGIRNHYFSIVNDPIEMRAGNLPLDIKLRLASRFLSVKESIDCAFHNRTAELIDLCVNVCNNHHTALDLPGLLQWLKKHDNLRGTNYQLVFPELAPHLELLPEA